MNYKKSIGVLNSFIQINNERIRRHRTASNETLEFGFKKVFDQCITTSQRCNDQLSKEVTLLGGLPVIEDTITSSNFIRAWINVEKLIESRDKHTLVNCCENSENKGMFEYKKTLQEGFLHLSHDQQTMIETQIQQLKADHLNVKRLKIQ